MKSILIAFLFNIIIFSQSFINEDLRSKIFKENEQDLLTTNNSYEASSFNKLDTVIWKKLNGPYGGYITAIETKGDTILVGTGVYKTSIFYSIDGGKNWTQANFIKLEQVNDFIFTDDNAVLACTDARTIPNSGGKIYKSFDLLNWNAIKLPFNNYEYWSLGKDLNGNLYSGTDEGYIFSSSNNGNSWKFVFESGSRIEDFITLPSGDIIACMTAGYLRKNKDSSFNKWVKYDMVPYQPLYPFFNDSNKLFFATLHQILAATDDGNSWNQISNDSFFDGEWMTDCLYNNNFIASFQNVISLGTGDGWGAAISNNGSDWRWSQKGLPYGISAYEVAKSGTNTYLGTMGAGLFKSTDFGESWFSSSNGISSAFTRGIAFDGDSVIYTASWHTGLARTTDKGKTWEDLNDDAIKQGAINFRALYIDKEGNIFAGGSGVFRSSDKGKTWLKTSIAGNDKVRLLTEFNKKLYALNYYGPLLNSSDKGQTWNIVMEGIGNSALTEFVIDSSGNFYAGGLTGSIYKSTNEGSSWFKIRDMNVSTIINSIQKFTNGDLFVSSSYEGILKSSDEGLTWEIIGEGFNNRNPGELIISSKDEIFLNLIDYGIIYSNDYGKTWQDITSEAKYLSVNEFKFDKNDNLYMATDQSLWKLDNLVITSTKDKNNIVNDFSLSTNYPNPFNPSTTIKYSISERGFVTIKVFDLLGREIRTLINEEKQTGSYEVTFNAEGLPSGIYFYSIHAGKFSETRKMLLVK